MSASSSDELLHQITEANAHIERISSELLELEKDSPKYKRLAQTLSTKKQDRQRFISEYERLNPCNLEGMPALETMTLKFSTDILMLARNLLPFNREVMSGTETIRVGSVNVGKIKWIESEIELFARVCSYFHIVLIQEFKPASFLPHSSTWFHSVQCEDISAGTNQSKPHLVVTPTLHPWCAGVTAECFAIVIHQDVASLFSRIAMIPTNAKPPEKKSRSKKKETNMAEKGKKTPGVSKELEEVEKDKETNEKQKQAEDKNNGGSKKTDTSKKASGVCREKETADKEKETNEKQKQAEEVCREKGKAEKEKETNEKQKQAVASCLAVVIANGNSLCLDVIGTVHLTGSGSAALKDEQFSSITKEAQKWRNRWIVAGDFNMSNSEVCKRLRIAKQNDIRVYSGGDVTFDRTKNTIDHLMCHRDVYVEPRYRLPLRMYDHRFVRFFIHKDIMDDH